MDSKAIFEMIFGSEKFEPILGELKLSQMMNMKEDEPAELLEFRQRKREVQLAVNLVKSLDLYISGKPQWEDDFQNFHTLNAQELSANPMGKMMLGKIANVYIEQATQNLGGLKSMGAHVDEVKSKWSAKMGVAKSMYATYKAAKKMEKDMKEEEKKSPSEEQKEGAEPEVNPRDMEKMKMMSENMIDVAWSITVYDIESTLRAAIDKIMRDKAVDKKLKERRAMGLLKLGKIYEQFGEKSEKGIQEMKKTIAMQMKGPPPDVNVNEDEYDFCDGQNKE